MRVAVATRPLLPLAAVTAGLASGSAVAAEWTFTPSGDVVAQSQQNPYLSADENRKHEVSNGFVGMVRLGVQRRTELSTFTLQPVIRAYRYDDDTILDRNEQDVNLGFSWKGEKVSWQTSANAARDTTLTSELGNTGLTQANLRHEVYHVSIGPTWSVSERWQVQSTVDAQENRYPGERFGLQNYRYSSAFLSATYVVTERFAFTVFGTAGLLESEGQGSGTTDTSANVQAQYGWSPLTSITASVGPSWVKTDTTRQRGVRYRFAVSHTLENGALSFSVGRRQSPSGFALLTELDEAALTFTTQLTERLSATAAASYTKRRNVLRVFNIDLQRVRYSRADLGLAWRMSPNWRLAFNAGAGLQQIGSVLFDDELTGRGYDVRLGFSWSGDPYVK